MKRLSLIALPGLLLCHLGGSATLAAMDRNPMNNPRPSAAQFPYSGVFQHPPFLQTAASSTQAINLPGTASLGEDPTNTVPPVHTLHPAGSSASSIELVGSGFAARWGSMYIRTPGGPARMTLENDHLLSVALPDPAPDVFTLVCGNQCMTFEVAAATTYRSLSDLLRPTGSRQSQDLLTHLRAAFTAGPPAGSPYESRPAGGPVLALASSTSASALVDSPKPTPFSPISAMTRTDSAASTPARAASTTTLAAPAARMWGLTSTPSPSLETTIPASATASAAPANRFSFPTLSPSPDLLASRPASATPAAKIRVSTLTASPSPEATRSASSVPSVVRASQPSIGTSGKPPARKQNTSKKRTHELFIAKDAVGPSMTALFAAASAEMESGQAQKRHAGAQPAAAAMEQDEPVGPKVGGIVQPNDRPHLIQVLGSGFTTYAKGDMDIRVDGKAAKFSIKSDNLIAIILPADTQGKTVEVVLDGQVWSTLNLEDGGIPYGQVQDLEAYGTFGLPSAQWAKLRRDLKPVVEELE